MAGVSYTGSEITNVHKTKEQSEHSTTYLARPNNNYCSFVLCHFSLVYESLLQIAPQLQGFTDDHKKNWLLKNYKILGDKINKTN